ncbi:hypothetical protein [Exiguobacterium sp. s191]|uniref:hypothetical protein n=1 Tax=Exiguobacterium sp. s191 TaxID=2751196 RepID=UPI001BEAFA82|nr:hypothetical protein [Exiguobacterium sp. s191]
MRDTILEFEKKSIELRKIIEDKKDLPENFLDSYCVRMLADDEFMLKYPSYSLKIFHHENFSFKLSEIEVLIKEYKIKERVILSTSYEKNVENENEVILSIDIMECPLEYNLRIVKEIENMLRGKKVRFKRKESYFEMKLIR